MWPLMNPQGVLGAVYTPTDGSIDPTGLDQRAGGRRQERRGALLHRDHASTPSRLKTGRVDEVVTDQGTIQTEVVVNATGQWGNEIGAHGRASTCRSSPSPTCT